MHIEVHKSQDGKEMLASHNTLHLKRPSPVDRSLLRGVFRSSRDRPRLQDTPERARRKCLCSHRDLPRSRRLSHPYNTSAAAHQRLYESLRTPPGGTPLLRIGGSKGIQRLASHLIPYAGLTIDAVFRGLPLILCRRVVRSLGHRLRSRSVVDRWNHRASVM